jgi:hypothetical protein
VLKNVDFMAGFTEEFTSMAECEPIDHDGQAPRPGVVCRHTPVHRQATADRAQRHDDGLRRFQDLTDLSMNSAGRRR